MSNVTSMDVNGEKVTIDSAEFVEFSQRAHDILDQIRELGLDYKDLMADVEKDTGLKKSLAGKYFKQKFKAATKENKIVADLFVNLDQITEG